jgi:hypothetical protein
MAGASYGQTLTCGGVQLFGIIAVERAEGQTELVQDIVNAGGNCTATAKTTGTAILTLNATVTSTGNSLFEVIDTTTDADTPTYYLGTVTGNQASFVNVTFPTSFSFHVFNVRINASTNPVNTYVSESVLVEYKSTQSVTGSAVASLGAANVGYIQKSLSVSLFSFGNFPVVNNYATCIGNPIPFGGQIDTNILDAGTNVSFQVQIGELVAGAFKIQYSAFNQPAPTQAGENGTSPENGGNGVQANTASGGMQQVLPDANSPTALTVTLANIPTQATVYLPFSITMGGDATPTTLTLKGAAAADVTPAGVKNKNVVGFTANANGTITVVYVVTQAFITGALTFPMPIEVIFNPNTAPAQTTPMTVQVGYAPAAAPLGPAGPSSIPTFALPAPPLNGSVIANCQTTLLFPYVTNETGYETGIAISNTTTDNLGNFLSPTGSFATPTPGTCTLNFYGNQKQPAQVTVPKTGNLGAWSATIAGQAPVFAEILSDLIAPATQFTGYAIANCNFLDAHGFAFLLDVTGSAGPYIATVIPRLTTAGPGVSADANPIGDGQ